MVLRHVVYLTYYLAKILKFKYINTKFLKSIHSQTYYRKKKKSHIPEFDKNITELNYFKANFISHVFEMKENVTKVHLNNLCYEKRIFI